MELFSTIAKLEETGRLFVLATVIDSQGSTPQKPGSKMVVVEGGETFGTVGGGAIELQIIEAATALIKEPLGTTRLIETHLTHDLGMCCGGKMRVFLERHGSAPRLWIFGAGHVAKELAALAHQVGFKVEVVDERAAWASTDRFPHASLMLKNPAEYAKTLAGGPESYFCVVTHDHPLDQACVEVLLPKTAAYLGVIGSRRKAERFKMRLRAEGFTDTQLSMLQSPMGIAIEALTPAEIAVSIVGELISRRRRQPHQR